MPGAGAYINRIAQRLPADRARSMRPRGVEHLFDRPVGWWSSPPAGAPDRSRIRPAVRVPDPSAAAPLTRPGARPGAPSRALTAATRSRRVWSRHVGTCGRVATRTPAAPVALAARRAYARAPWAAARTRAAILTRPDPYTARTRARTYSVARRTVRPIRLTPPPIVATSRDMTKGPANRPR